MDRDKAGKNELFPRSRGNSEENVREIYFQFVIGFSVRSRCSTLIP